MSRLASTGTLAPVRPRGIAGWAQLLLARVRAALGTFHLQGGAPLLDAVLDSAIDAWPARIYVGLMGVLGFPLYYVVWTYWSPQPYESIGLRLACAALFLPFLLPRSWLEPLRRYWPWYWHGTLLLSLPFFFLFMALENNTAPWALSYVTAMMFTLVLAPAPVAAVMLLAGTAMATSLHLLRHPSADLSAQLIVQAWPVILFTLGGGLVLNIAVAQHKRRRTQALLSVAGFVAHELRTPLTAMEMQLAACARAPGSMEERLPAMQREAQRAHIFIDMLLASIRPANVQAQESELAPVSITNVVRSAVQRYPYANERQRKAVQVQLSHDFTVAGVEILLEHLVLNLMKNAFTHAGGAAGFRIAVTSESRPGARVLTISDNGRGIAAEDLPRVLDRYYRGGSHPGGAVGSGLGLSFCQDVMRSLGGQLEVQSAPGAGTSVKLVFPHWPADQQVSASASVS